MRLFELPRAACRCADRLWFAHTMPRVITIALAVVMAAPAAATLNDLSALMEQQEGLVLELAAEVEVQHRQRCGLTVSDCQEKSYDNCGTRYPCQTCPASGLDIAACGSGKGGLFDYTVSSAPYR